MHGNPFTALMSAAKAHALAHGAVLPALSPHDDTLLQAESRVDVDAIHALGLKVVPWTTNDPTRMRTLIAMRVDGLISDRPDLLQQALAQSRSNDPFFLGPFDVQGHRGARGLRPENTLPAFEAGLDHLVSTIETDTGVTQDLHSVLWHDQFLNPDLCRRADGQTYNFATALFFRDITLAELQSTFLCDTLHPRFPDQGNDLAHSPVAAAFAAQQHLPSAWTPVTVSQLFRFTAFYAEFYRTGDGHTQPNAAARAANAARVRFNLETKILPFPDGGHSKPTRNEEPTTNHTVDPQTFVSTLCAAITRARLQSRCTVQSFDFRTLQLVAEQFPTIATSYLTETPQSLSSNLIPPSLRQP